MYMCVVILNLLNETESLAVFDGEQQSACFSGGEEDANNSKDKTENDCFEIRTR
jgi:hypothetical protein